MTKLPATLVESEAVDIICGWIDKVAERLTSEKGRRVLRDYIRDRVRQGTLPTMQVIASAKAGNDDADIALRELVVEMLDRGEMPPAALRAYAQEALIRAPVPSLRGRSLADTWMRDAGFVILIALAAQCWQLPPTRNRASKKPSAAYLVEVALNRKGFNITEARLNKIYGSRDQLADRLSASIPPI
jgi:hypothetical protein